MVKLLGLYTILIIVHVHRREILAIKTTAKISVPNLPIIIENALTNSAINGSVPINVPDISKKMANGFKAIQSNTVKLLKLKVFPSVNTENLLNLVSVVNDVFNYIISTTRGLEHKLHGIIGFIDLPIISIQVALKTIIQTIVVNVIITLETNDTIQNDINYSLLGIADGIQLLLDRTYKLISGIVTLPGNDLAKSILCLEGIVQTILSIIENILLSLNEFLLSFEMKCSENVAMTELIRSLTNSLNKLANKLTNPVTRVVKKLLEPTLLSLISSLKGNMNSVTNSSLDLVKNIIDPINALVESIAENQKRAIMRSLSKIPYIIQNVPSSVLSVSKEIQTLPGNTIGIKSTFIVALSNVIASLHSLTTYLTFITTFGFTTVTVSNTSKLLLDTKTVLLLLATNFQTLVDTATQAIRQSLIHGMKTRNMKVRGKNDIMVDLKDLQEIAMRISLLLENMVKVNLHAMQTLLNAVSQAIRYVLVDYSKSLGAVAASIGSIVGDLSNLIGESITRSTNSVASADLSNLSNVTNSFKMTVNNVENLRIFVRNVFKEIESVV